MSAISSLSAATPRKLLWFSQFSISFTFTARCSSPPLRRSSATPTTTCPLSLHFAPRSTLFLPSVSCSAPSNELNPLGISSLAPLTLSPFRLCYTWFPPSRICAFCCCLKGYREAMTSTCSKTRYKSPRMLACAQFRIWPFPLSLSSPQSASASL